MRLRELDEMMAASDFWDKGQEAKAIARERAQLESYLNNIKHLQDASEEVDILLQLADEENDKEAISEAREALQRLERGLNHLETTRLLGEPDDALGAIVAVNSGAGGTDAQDWAEMLVRQYMRYAERNGFKLEIMDWQEGEEAGIKSVTLQIEGAYAYGLLKGETGIHRLVRISPFDSNHRRHTAFASLLVSPLLDDNIVIDLKEADIRVDVYRASGAGGQHVNKTSSAVRLTHIPTGVVVQCQNEKSQHRNKDMAMKVLKARLYQLEQDKINAGKKQQHQSHQDIAWGSQIRSYVLAPYRLVKDHRTGIEMGNVDAVLDGDLESFINGFLLWRNNSQNTAA
jgi:peptide chain release factor 2